MKHLVKLVLLLLPALALFGADTPATAVPDADTPKDFVVICPIEGEINDGTLIIVQRAIQEAQGAKAIIFEVDTFGGRVDAAVDITSAILDAPCETIAYIKGRGAISAGAIISFACNKITMEPATNIGAAQVIIAGAEGSIPAGEKETSFVRAKIRALAEANGHNPDIAAAMVDKDILLRGMPLETGKVRVYATNVEEAPPFEKDSPLESLSKGVDEALEQVEDETGIPMKDVKEIAQDALEELSTSDSEKVTDAPAPASDGSVLIDADDKLLTLTSDDAMRFDVIPSTCKSIDEAMGLFELGGLAKQYHTISRAERFAWWLMTSNVSAILLLLGAAGIYFEIKTPGFGLPGILGIVCLSLYFGARYVIGVAEVLDLLLLVAGGVLILLEIFVFPGFGLAGVSGIICLFVGFYLSLTKVTFPVYAWDFARLQDAGLQLVVAGIAMIFFVYLAAKLFPKTPMYNKLVLTATMDAGAGYTVQSEEAERVAKGLQGVAESVLRPAGRARFNGKIYDVVSIGDFIEQGTPVEIIEVTGNRYVVDVVQEKKQ